MKIKKSQRGQVLLIIILISTVLLTVGLSISQITTQETKIAKLEEESKKAFAAAEAGIDARLKLQTDITNIASILPPDSGIVSGQATLDETPKPTFITPLLKKDEQYTFYLTTYDPTTHRIGGAAFDGSLIIRLNQPGGDYCNNDQTKLAVELTFINKDTNSITRKLIDQCGLVAGATDELNFSNSFTSPQAHLLLLRIIAIDNNFPGAKLEIINNEAAPNNRWPAQGKTITSQATTATGVSKKIQLFQSYPQIPADFFVTSF